MSVLSCSWLKSPTRSIPRLEYFYRRCQGWPISIQSYRQNVHLGGSKHNLEVHETAPEAYGDAYKVTIMSQTDVH